MIGGNQKTGTADTGVIISLSTTKEQITGMKKIRTDLQEKINNITQSIRDKVKETQDTISDYQKTKQDKTDKTLDKKTSR